MNRNLRAATGSGAARQETLREHNLAVVARAVIDAPAPRSRADVSAATGLTRATVSALVDRLVEAGILHELPPAAPQRAGRPAVPLAPAPRTIVGLGLEVNVDYLGGRVLDLAGDVVAERVVPGDFHAGAPADVLGRLGGIARDLTAEVTAGGMRLAGARLALPGLVDTRVGRLRIAPNLGWSQLDPVPLLALDPHLRVGIANEAKLAALAQLRVTSETITERARPGDETGASSYLYVSGDVGIGSAIVVDGVLFQGRHGWAGEIGHVVVDPNGPRCTCGATGCLERFAGKDALLQGAGLPASAPLDALLDLIAAGNPAATAAVDRAATALGSALADYVNLVDVPTVLLGGIYPPLLASLRPLLDTTLSARVLAAPWMRVDVRAAPVGDHAALTGGAGQVLRAVVDDPSAWTNGT